MLVSACCIVVDVDPVLVILTVDHLDSLAIDLLVKARLAVGCQVAPSLIIISQKQPVLQLTSTYRKRA